MNGQLRGKRGGNVYYRAEGQQVSRSRNFSPRNPRTMPQMLQRLFLGNASKAAAGLKEIVDHSFEGIQYGAKSVRFFEANAQLVLKNATPTQKDSYKMTPCVPLDALGFPIAKYMISKGSLPSIEFEAIKEVTSGLITHILLPGFESFEDVDEFSVQDFLTLLGVPSNAQLTFVSTHGQDSLGGASTEYIFEDNVLNPIIRLNFDPAKLDQTLFSNTGAINADVLVKEKSNNWDLIQATLADGKLMIANQSYSMNSIAVIVSAYEAGAWRRSTEVLEISAVTGTQVTPAIFRIWGWNDFDLVKESLYTSGTPAEDRFLNKEDN